MKKIRFLLFFLGAFVFLGSSVFASGNVASTNKSAQSSSSSSKTVAAQCKWVKLNTNLPFLWNCIGASEAWGNKVTQLNAFAVMVKWLMKIIISIVLVMSFLMIVAAGVLMTTDGYDSGSYKKWVTMISTVAKALALLGASGVILKLINPNFFT